jgi:DNA-binding transcriptional regulator GbsR (MarR family)
VGREESSRKAFDEFYAEYFVDRLNLPASVGRIAAALMLSREPLSQADLRASLSLSEGSVSEGLRLLVDGGHVERAGDPRARPAYFQMRAASWSWPLARTLGGMQATYENALRMRKHFDEFGAASPSRELVERSIAMYEVLLSELPAVFDKAQEAGERVRATPPRRSRAG